VGLDWNDLKAVEAIGAVDVVLLADTLWVKEYHAALLRTLLMVLRPHTLAVFAFMHHDTTGEVAETFLSLLLEHAEVVSRTQHDWRETKTNVSKEDYGDVHIVIVRKRAA
jgi:predicted nicotinamide N-methyase